MDFHSVMCNFIVHYVYCLDKAFCYCGVSGIAGVVISGPKVLLVRFPLLFAKFYLS